MVVRRGANSCAYCLRIREEISSGPVALDGSSLLSSFPVPLAVTVISGIDGQLSVRDSSSSFSPNHHIQYIFIKR
jgi:hypothetical protein